MRTRRSPSKPGGAALRAAPPFDVCSANHPATIHVKHCRCLDWSVSDGQSVDSHTTCWVAISALAGCALTCPAAWPPGRMAATKTALRSLMARTQEMLGSRVRRRDAQWVEMPVLWPSPKRFYASAQTGVQRNGDTWVGELGGAEHQFSPRGRWLFGTRRPATRRTSTA